MKISVVVPLYKCQPFVNELTNRLIQSVSQITKDFEIIYVNDCSPLEDWEEVSRLCEQDDRIKGINFSRNFGQHYAITAGIEYANGDWIVVMDGDLQDKPEDVVLLYNYAVENKFDVVWGRRIDRKDAFFKRLSSRIFHIVFNFLSDSVTDRYVANFSIINRKVAVAFIGMKEQNRVYPLFVRWLGFKSGYVDVNHGVRSGGESSYDLHKLFRLAINSALNFSNKPLNIAVYLGVIISLVTIVASIFEVNQYTVSDLVFPMWLSVLLSLWFIFGVLLIFIGLLGLYIGRLFTENKKRPLYVVNEVLNIDKK